MPPQLLRPAWQESAHEPAEHTFPAGHGVAARAAVGDVGLEVRAGPRAVGEAGLAGERARAVRAHVARRGTRRAADAAVRAVRLEVHAGPAAVGEAGLARERAHPRRADLPGRAGDAARAAVLVARLQADAGPAAVGEARLAGERARAARSTRRPRGTRRPQAPQLRAVRLEVHARAAAVGERLPGSSAHGPAVQTLPAGASVAARRRSCRRRSATLVHVPPQLVSPAWHDRAHAPPEQALPAGQTVPHAPQLLPSVWRSTQVPPQLVSPAWHESPHTPAGADVARRAGHPAGAAVTVVALQVDAAAAAAGEPRPGTRPRTRPPSTRCLRGRRCRTSRSWPGRSACSCTCRRRS